MEDDFILRSLFEGKRRQPILFLSERKSRVAESMSAGVADEIFRRKLMEIRALASRVIPIHFDCISSHETPRLHSVQNRAPCQAPIWH